ncbi:F0F1 ATP synthase subunit delta [Bacillaceae bacterium S4-13-58]
MSNPVVAKRYAVALFQIGKEKSMLEILEEELRTVREVFVTNDKLLPYLNHPGVSRERKHQLLDTAFKGISKEIRNTLALLVDRRREDSVVDMIQFFMEQSNDYRNIADADVYSVRELTNDEKKELEQIFTAKSNKSSIRIRTIIDPSIIGGVKLKIGNRIYDGSISGKLARIERSLLAK